MNSSVLAAKDASFNYSPPGGVVPTKEVAIHVAKAILDSIYGEAQIKDEEPLTATLKDDTWTVEGNLPQGMVGGVALIEISKSKGCVIRISHGQ
jgi:hypothetical protein